MRKRIGKIIPGLTVVCTAVLALSGCVGRSAGGTLDSQGFAALENEQYQEALEDFEAAVTKNEKAVPTYRGMGLAYMGLARYEEAIEAFDKALSAADDKMQETVRDLLLYKASAQYRIHDYEGTVAPCEQLLEETQDSSEAYYLRGAGYLGLGYQDKAKVNFDAAVALAPSDYTLYLSIYECYESQNLSGIGDEYLQTALGINASSDDDWYHIGQIYFYLEQFDEAADALTTPVENQYLPAMRLMGRVYLAKEDYTHAQVLFESILETDGESPETYNGLALCSIESGDYEKALEYIHQGQALEESKGQQELAFNEIVVYEKELDFETAKEKAAAYVEKYPTDEAGQKELKFLSTR